MDLTFKTLRKVNIARCESFHSLDDWTNSDWAMALAGEVGELCNKLKKRRRGDYIEDYEISEELADIIFYTDLLAARLKVDLEKAVVDKFNKVSERYNSPIRLENGSSTIL